MDLFEPLPGHMGVDLGGGQVAMAQQHLHHPQVRPVVEQMGGKGVTQGMGGQGLANPSLQGIALDEQPEGLAGHAATAYRGEQVIAHPPVEDVRTPLPHIGLEPGNGLFPQWDQALLVALARHPHHPLHQAHGLRGQGHQLRHPQPRGVEDLQHGAIALAAWLVSQRSAQQGLDLGLGEGLGQGPPKAGGVHPGLTLISCFPFKRDTHRILVFAHLKEI